MNYPARALLVPFLALLLSACDESLPPKNDPLVVVRAGFAMNTGIVAIKDSLVTGLPGTFEGFLENTFSEVLQDSQRVRMVVDVWLKSDPAQRTHLVFTRANVVEPQYLNGEILTLEPRMPLHIFGSWSHRTDGSAWYWSFVDVTGPYFTPGAGEQYYQSDTVTLVVEATLQGYKRVAAVRLGPFEYSFVYRIF